MPRECFFTGARTRVGRSLRYRGKAKYLGGIGRKVTSAAKRTFKPNLQTVTTMMDGKPRRIKVSTRVIKQGLIVKPVRRKYVYKTGAKA
jgi:large subunit ribosomal protein L28